MKESGSVKSPDLTPFFTVLGEKPEIEKGVIVKRLKAIS